MKVTRTDLDKAFFKVVKAVYILEQIEEAYPGIEEETEDLGLTINGKPYNYEKLIGEVVAAVDDLENVLEGAKETIIDHFDEAPELLFSLERIFVAKESGEIDTSITGRAQKYYMLERYVDLPHVVERAKHIKPLLTRRKVPAFIKRKYREAILCYFDGRFDGCCTICRSIVEILLKRICEKRFGEKKDFENRALFELIDTCEKWHILGPIELRAIRRIKKTANRSLHTELPTTQQEALASIKDIQRLLRGLFSDRGTET